MTVTIQVHSVKQLLQVLLAESCILVNTGRYELLVVHLAISIVIHFLERCRPLIAGHFTAEMLTQALINFMEIKRAVVVRIELCKNLCVLLDYIMRNEQPRNPLKHTSAKRQLFRITIRIFVRANNVVN